MEATPLSLTFLIIMISILPIPSESDSCKRRCGKMEIPYPFGVEKECYLDETFKILCNESAGSAILDWVSEEVDYISLEDHSLRCTNVRSYVMPFDKSGVGLNSTSDLTGSHYTISHTKNKFYAVGCDFYVYMIDVETKEFEGGCAPLCNRTDIAPSRSSACSDLGCCDLNFPKDIRNMTYWVQTVNTPARSWAHNCAAFGFVDNGFLLHNKIKYDGCNESRYTFPVIVEWAVGVGDTTCAKATQRGDYVCGLNTECTDYSPGKGYRCKCKKGYIGNPYLRDGCNDVNECASSKSNNCQENNTCVNTQGSYVCLPNKKRMIELFLSLGIGLAVGLLLLVALGFWTWRKLKRINNRKTKMRLFKRNGGLLLQQQILTKRGSLLPEQMILFKIEELEKATDKFSEDRIVGKGGLGTVYKGMLSDGRIVAVKKANKIDDSQVGQFINEVFILSQISHRHIVKLLGCCLEAEVPLLVYEYISNGTLSHHLHNESNSSTFSWLNRLRVAAEVAGALTYLHSCVSTAIFHRDVKSSNILLDENFKAVISDFGLSKSVSIDKTHLTTLVGGTFGYLDPEYFRSGQLNDKSDVYAFGVVLAEILTGQKAVSSSKDDRGLAIRFRSAMKEHRLFEILEEIVACEGQEEEILVVAKLAKRCLKVNARKRPHMKEVAGELDQLMNKKEVRGPHVDDKCCSISEHCSSFGTDLEVEEDLTILSRTCSSSLGGNNVNI